MRDRLSAVKWSFIDFLLSLSACLLVAFFLISVQKKQQESKETDRSAGNISVYVFWPDGDTDIDTHLMSPDGDHVYFSHKSGTVWSLLRDDLGNTSDVTTRNFENSYARGAPPGEYAVNVQAYRNNAKFPVEVEAELRIQADPKNYNTVVTFTARVTLDRIGDEATLWRFTIDNQGALVPGSVHKQFIPLARDEK